MATKNAKTANRKQLPFTPEVRQRWREVRNLILAEPEKYDQREWCGTAMCLAGWFHMLTPESEREGSADLTLAKFVTGVDEYRITTAMGRGWPEPFASEFCNECDEDNRPLVKAQIAARRITHLITKGE